MNFRNVTQNEQTSSEKIWIATVVCLFVVVYFNTFDVPPENWKIETTRAHRREKEKCNRKLEKVNQFFGLYRMESVELPWSVVCLFVRREHFTRSEKNTPLACQMTKKTTLKFNDVVLIGEKIEIKEREREKKCGNEDVGIESKWETINAEC